MTIRICAAALFALLFTSASASANVPDYFGDNDQTALRNGARDAEELRIMREREIGLMLENEQRARNMAAAQARAALPSDPRLIPLAPNTGISPATVSIIKTTLATSLEMDGPDVARKWENQQTGAHGLITVQKITTNVLGEPCRAFTITNLQDVTHSVDGTACYKNGQWAWIDNP
jgi:hypothetical protein